MLAVVLRVCVFYDAADRQTDNLMSIAGYTELIHLKREEERGERIVGNKRTVQSRSN